LRETRGTTSRSDGVPAWRRPWVLRAGLWLFLTCLVAWGDVDRFLRGLSPLSPEPFISFPKAIRSFAIEKDARPGPLPHVFRLKYPSEWLEDGAAIPRPLAVFVDGNKAAWLLEEPAFAQLGPERAYAYVRDSTSRSLFVVCPQDAGCVRVDVIRDGLGGRMALARSAPGATGVFLATLSFKAVLLGLLLGGLTRLGPALLRLGPVSEWSEGRRYAVAGLGLVLAASAPLLTTLRSVRWDATDLSLPAFRWIGSCLREGSLCEYFPNVFSGYTIAGHPEFYNVAYLAIALLFPDSVLSINVLYLLIQGALLLVCFRLGRRLGIEPIGCFSLGLSLVASGFFVGHAEHSSFLISALSATMIVAGLLDLSGGIAKAGCGLIAGGCYLLGSAGYPALMVSIALVATVLFGHELARASSKARMAGLTAGSVLAGALLAAPGLVHFWSSLQRSQRVQGLTAPEVMGGSLPLYSLANFLLPSWHWPVSASATDVSMDRLHLLHLTPWILAALLLLPRFRAAAWPGPIASRAKVWSVLIAVFLILSLGSNFPVPMRQWMAEHWMLFRLGRFPGAEYIYFVQLFAAILASAGVAEVARRMRFGKPAAAAFLAVDFLVVMTATSGLRMQETSSETRGTMPRFKVIYEGKDEALLREPRDCPDPSKKSVDHTLAPSRFSWWGYSPMLPEAYVREMGSMAWALCSGPRLWDVATRRAVPYTLLRYSPSFVSIRFEAPEGARDLLWAETVDPYWTLSVNGRAARFDAGLADLRYFSLPEGTRGQVEVEMRYLGPLSRFWR
jgi:hypothetical protein